MKNIILKTALISILALFANANEQDLNQENKIVKQTIKPYGHNLFTGNFINKKNTSFNPEYKIQIQDSISLKLYGAIEQQLELTVDNQGNIFVPEVGEIKVQGIKNSQLNKLIKNKISSVYKNNVSVYANLNTSQQISVFVTGNVNKPGLYNGFASDSIINYIDRANGINNEVGSYRQIQLLRNNENILNIDLYSFLNNGYIPTKLLKTNDVILVKDVKDHVYVTGEVQKPYKFELKNETTTLKQIASLAQISPNATNAVVKSYQQQNKLKISKYSKKEFKNVMVNSGDEIKFVKDVNAQNINITISGEHNNLQNIVVKKGTTLNQLLENINFSNLSQKNSVQLFRKSIAKIQKELLDASLKDLENSVVKTGSSTTEESAIRAQETKMVLEFVDRAKQVQPKGRVVLTKNTDYNKIILEEEDVIYIPKKSNVITVQGEVKIPSGIAFVEDFELKDYVKQCGGYSVSANEDNILIIKQNGNVVTYNDSLWSDEDYKINPGDSILVLGDLDSKNIPVVKSITQILYQIAVSAGVLLQI